ncbi:MAG TPA: FUSC family protein [Dokdonella sp.]
MLNTLLQLKPRDVPVRVALRNTAAVALPLALGLATDHAGPGLAIAVGALNTMFSDQPGPYRLRMQRMLLAASAAGLSAFVGSVIGASAPWLVAAAALWGFAGGLLVALGPEPARVGLTSMILLVIMAAQPRAPQDAIGPALLVCAGGVLQTLFAIAAWPLQRYRPERHALAGVCRQLAASARARADADQAPPVTQALLDAENLLHGSHRARGPAMEAFRVLAEIVERARIELLAIGDLDAALPEGDARRTLARLREYAARALVAIADALERGASPLAAAAALEGYDAALASLKTLRAREPDRRVQRLLAIAAARGDGLGGQLRAATRNAEIAGSRGELRAAERESRLPRALRPRNPLAILRANLGLSSIACRHAIRCSVCLAIAVALERALALPHGFWFPMTAAIVLKPDFAGTLSFGVLRVIGTILGLVLTSVLVHVAFGGAWERLLLLAVLCFGFRELTAMHYALGVMLLTGLVVILLSFEGIAPGETMLARGVATAAGSALSLTAYALWPTWEHARVQPALAAMIEAYRAYFAALLGGGAQARANARSLARSARTNVQASLDRLRNEPRRDRELVALAEGVFANANRFVRATMALEAVLGDPLAARDDGAPAAIPERERVLEFAARVEAALAALATALRDGAAPNFERLRPHERALAQALAAVGADEATSHAAIAIADACDRMTDSIDTIAYLLRKARERS